MDIWRTIKVILNGLYLRYDADISAIPPPPRRTTDQTRPRTKVKEPDNLVRDKADNTPRIFEDTDSGRVWELWTDGSGRSSMLTDADRKAVEDRGLDLEKYGIIKVTWSSKNNRGKYLSAKQASRQLTRDLGRGYGRRTVEKYFAAINEANPSPHVAAEN